MRSRNASGSSNIVAEPRLSSRSAAASCLRYGRRNGHSSRSSERRRAVAEWAGVEMMRPRWLAAMHRCAQCNASAAGCGRCAPTRECARLKTRHTGAAPMKALVKRRAEPGLWMEHAPVPTVGTNEVLFCFGKTGICGTDLHIKNWDDWAQRNIHVLRIVGHEFVGHIVEVGPGVDGYKVGDRVSGEGHITCGICRNCRAGKRHLCHRAIGIGGGRDGAFAEYLVMPATNLWPVHDDISSDIASILDPFGNAVHCALSFDVVGEDALITGAGPIGLMACAVCRHIGAGHETD